MPLRGPSPARIAVVGEAPGKEEDESGRPFVGPSGRLAQELLSQAGIDAEEVAWMNVVSCWPGRTPTSREVEACRGNLDAQLGLVEPDYILILGGVAVGAWWPGLRMGEVRGLWWRIPIVTSSTRKDAWALATWHPSAILRSGGERSTRGQEAANDLYSFRLCSDEEVEPWVVPKCVKCGEYGDMFDREIAYCSIHHPRNIEVLMKAGRKRSGKEQGSRR